MNEGEHADGQDPIQEMSYPDITEQLRQLEGKSDSVSQDLWDRLTDRLMCLDMALQPYRRAMGTKRSPQE